MKPAQFKIGLWSNFIQKKRKEKSNCEKNRTIINLQLKLFYINK